MILKNNLNPEKIKLLVFDLDGCITRWIDIPTFFANTFYSFGINYEQEYEKAIFAAMNDFKINSMLSYQFNVEEYAWFLGKNLPILIQYNISVYDFMRRMFELEIENIFITNDSVSTLESLKRKYLLIIKTDWFQEQAEKKLDRFNLRPYFVNIHSWTNSHFKQTKAGYEFLLYTYKIVPEEFVMIGNEKTDIKFARKSQSILMDYQEQNGPQYFGATSACSEFEDLKRILIKD